MVWSSKIQNVVWWGIVMWKLIAGEVTKTGRHKNIIKKLKRHAKQSDDKSI